MSSCYLLQAEQKAIYEANDGCKKPLTWAQIRNMPLTYRVSPTLTTLVFKMQNSTKKFRLTVS